MRSFQVLPNRGNRREIWKKDLKTRGIVRSQESGVRSQESGVRSQESEVEGVIERIAASPGGDELLARIEATLSKRERDFLWGYLCQTDACELGYLLEVEKQTVHNYLSTIEQKLGFDSRTELLRQVFSALLRELKKS